MALVGCGLIKVQSPLWTGRRRSAALRARAAIGTLLSHQELNIELQILIGELINLFVQSLKLGFGSQTILKEKKQNLPNEPKGTHILVGCYLSFCDLQGILQLLVLEMRIDAYCFHGSGNSTDASKLNNPLL